jgi:hypothetical protein
MTDLGVNVTRQRPDMSRRCGINGRERVTASRARTDQRRRLHHLSSRRQVRPRARVSVVGSLRADRVDVDGDRGVCGVSDVDRPTTKGTRKRPMGDR